MKPTTNRSKNLQLFTNLIWSKYWHGSLLNCHTELRCKWFCRNFRGDFWAAKATFIHLHPFTSSYIHFYPLTSTYYVFHHYSLGLCHLLWDNSPPRPLPSSNNPKESFQHQGTLGWSSSHGKWPCFNDHFRNRKKLEVPTRYKAYARPMQDAHKILPEICY